MSALNLPSCISEGNRYSVVVGPDSSTMNIRVNHDAGVGLEPSTLYFIVNHVSGLGS